MPKILKKFFLTFLAMLMANFIFMGQAFCNLEVTSLHVDGMTEGEYYNNYTEVTLLWGMPDGYTKGQISKFVCLCTTNEASDLTTAGEIISYTGYNEDNDVDPADIVGDTFSTVINLEDIINEANFSFYFYVAAIKSGQPPSPANYGVSDHVGAYYIDNYSPINPYIKEVNDETIVSDSEVTFSMSASDIGGLDCVRYWFLNYGNKPTNCLGALDDVNFPYTKSLELPDYEIGPYPKTYVIMAEFQDNAGNKSATTSYQIQYMPDIQASPVITGIPTLSEWGILIFLGIILLSSFILLKRYSIKI